MSHKGLKRARKKSWNVEESRRSEEIQYFHEKMDWKWICDGPRMMNPEHGRWSLTFETIRIVEIDMTSQDIKVQNKIPLKYIFLQRKKLDTTELYLVSKLATKM